MRTRETTLEDTRSGRTRSTPTDEQVLVAQAKSGHRAAFGELYERYRLRLYRSAFRILRNRQDAEDAVQRSFQRALTRLTGFREDSALGINVPGQPPIIGPFGVFDTRAYLDQSVFNWESIERARSSAAQVKAAQLSHQRE